jgi:hypothetical protein
MTADHNILGIADPVPDVKKRLKVVYSYAVLDQAVIANEGETISLP